jgi:hypothetical protein
MPWWGWILIVIAVIVIIPLKLKVWKMLLEKSAKNQAEDDDY